ncbi:hypothetical protein RhiLY_04763 [Ceratobasidium sp. AG-Ba]|nr:hypothetical protein RhiLY_04763 [Ceratobasidium sp. AG-Ba]
MGGQVVELSDFMPKNKSLLSSNRLLRNSSGEEFEWKLERKIHCVNVATDANVATFYRATHGIFHKKHPAYIDISEQVIHEQDLFVLACLIMEIHWRYQHIFSNAAVSVAVV